MKNSYKYRRYIILIGVFICLLFVTTDNEAQRNISPKNFSNLIKEISEVNGYFAYDNWITNERNYLDIIEPLIENNIQGGVYIGVGPNQNYTFIEAIKPDIAFIIDIRQQMTMQHLVYKIIFELAETRYEFFSLLFSKPLPENKIFNSMVGINDLVDLFYGISSNMDMLQTTSSKIISILEKKYDLKLQENDKKYINRTMKMFFLANLDIAWDMTEHTYRDENKYVRLSEILKAVDKKGLQLNLFNSADKYNFIRKMQLENRIIPIAGDFAGNQSFKKLSKYLKSNNYLVSSFYISNVEYWLFKDNKFTPYVDNIKHLPISESSVIMRQNLQTINNKCQYKFRLQYINEFLKNYNHGITQYEELLNLNYIY